VRVRQLPYTFPSFAIIHPHPRAPHSLTDGTDAADGRRALSVLPGILVEPTWLEQGIGAPGVRVIDLRESDAFSESHIPGAVQLDLAALGRTEGGCDNVLLPPDTFAPLMGALGIGTGDLVVAYDDQWGLAAARLVWALHFYGHPTAAVLEGGWDRWSEEGRIESTEASTPEPATFRAIASPEVGAERGWLVERVPGAEPKLIDTRTTLEFDQGHLPGASSWDWFNAVPHGSWDSSRDSEDLRTEWGALGIDPSHEVVVYCRSGMRAAHTYVVLKHAGFSRVRLYDGSWQEWSMNE
jgi:thiosulfate/3-mercaptopyruvate sulfurtransferase